MKIHWAAEEVVDNELTADWSYKTDFWSNQTHFNADSGGMSYLGYCKGRTVEYWPEVALGETTIQPVGGEVLDAASTNWANARKTICESIIFGSLFYLLYLMNLLTEMRIGSFYSSSIYLIALCAMMRNVRKPIPPWYECISGGFP